MRALITGGNGFVGRHLAACLRERGDDVLVAGRPHDGGDVDLPFELRDGQSVDQVIETARPDAVFHLAAQAFVPEGNRDPLATYETNVMGTARLFEALRRHASNGDAPRVLYVSSAEIYGRRPAGEQPLREEQSPKPATPYAASKVAGEAIVLASYATFGIPGIVARAFNHIGPGQSERFAVAGFAAGLAAIALGARPPRLDVGNIEARRDFLDVRDVVRAYVALVERAAPGEVYNVCSGTPVAIKEVLRQLIAIANVPVEVREDPARLRPSDTPLSCGDNGKLRRTTGWEPQFALGRSLRDAFADALARREASLAGGERRSR